MAVVVQRLVQADISGVLFTADPVTGSRMCMMGNFVHGLGERLVSGEANPQVFALKRPEGQYDGSSELKRFARRLYRLASRLEEDLGCPQDIEWAIAGGKLFLLQSRPITTLRGHNPATGEWNDSLTGDFLWTNANFCEAISDVMTPCTWSMWQVYTSEVVPVRIPGNYPLVGNIGGRPYINLGLLMSVSRVLGMSGRDVLQRAEDLWGRVPEEIDVPLIPFSISRLLRMILPGIIKVRRILSASRKEIPEFVAECSQWCTRMRHQIRQASSKAELAAMWCEKLDPYFRRAWRIGRAALESRPAARLRRDLIELVGTADANALLSNLGGSGHLASLGPLVGLSKVARGEMRRGEYMERYGHRGPHEMEISVPRPAKVPNWLDRQLAEFARSPVDVETLLAKQQSEFDAAWKRFQGRYPREAKSVRRRIDRVSAAARMRETVRSEATRVIGVARAFAVCAGELTGLGDDVFFLSLGEILDVLSGDDAATAFIPARRETHARYSALPPYPVIISGRFDPFQWAADPNRRSDLFDAHAPSAAPSSGAIKGFAGASGLIEGLVRRLDSPEEGEQLQPGEILVTATTNIGWTLLFPRAAAIVTDVGAPLSHAAIVARELGIPAVVGCGNATMRLRTGDRVLVNGGQGIVEILDSV